MAGKKPIPLSPSQRQIMEIVWEQGEVSAFELRKLLAPKRRLARETVRTLLHRMERKGWVESEWGLSDNNRRAKYYQLTQAGRKALNSERATWVRYAEAVARVFEAPAPTFP